MCFAYTKGASSVAAFSFAAAIALLREQASQDRTVIPNENGPAGEAVTKAATFRDAGIPLPPTPLTIVEAAALEDQSATADHQAAVALAEGLIVLFEKAERGAFSSSTQAALRQIAEGIYASKEANDALNDAYKTANEHRAEAMTD